MRLVLMFVFFGMILFCNGCASNVERELLLQSMGRRENRHNMRRSDSRKKSGKGGDKAHTTSKATVATIKVPGKRVKMLKMQDGTIIESGKSIREIIYNTVATDKIKSCGTFTYEGRKDVFFAGGGWDYLLEGANGLRCYWVPACLEMKSGEMFFMLFPYPLDLQIPSEKDIREDNFNGHAYFGWSGNRILLKENFGNIDQYPLVAVAFPKNLPAAKVIEKYRKEFPDAIVTDHPHDDRGGGIAGTIENDDIRIIFASRYGDEITFIVVIDKKIEEYFGRGWQKEKERQEAISNDEKEKRKQKKLDF